MQTISDLGSYTFPAMLANTLKKYSDRPAVAYCGDTPITYREVGVRIEDLKNRLYRFGVNAGDRVGLFGTSSPNWGIAYFAIVSLGAIAVPLLPDFNSKEAETCLKHAGATALIVSSRIADKVADPASIGIGPTFKLDDFSVIHGTETRQGLPPAHAVAENDTASIIYTSGTTGRSKGVELSHKNLVFTAINGQFFQRINQYDVALSILPMSHVYEFTIGYLMFFMNGSCVYYLEKAPTVSSLLPALKQVRPTLMLSVPIIMEKIYKNKIVPTFTSKPAVARLYAIPLFRKLFHRIAGVSLKKTFGGRMKFFGIGGAKVDPVVERFLKEAKFPYAVGYGLTETSPLLAGSGPKVTKPGSIGRVMPGVELKIVDPDPETGIGEVVVRGANVMKGYYKDPEQTAQVLSADGWFRTGDLGVMDRKGVRLSLKGRSKNMILGASGENIYPEDIEFVLNQHPYVAESLVVEGENSALVALVQLDEERVNAEARKRAAGEIARDAVSAMSDAFNYKREEVLNEIKFFVNANVNRISRIDRVEMIEKFEKTASQKIKRYLYNLKQKLPTGRSHP